MSLIMNGNSGIARKKLLALIAVVALALAGGYGYNRYTHDHEGEKAGAAKELYTCGMHPWIIADKPGDCPICGMKLTKLDSAPAGAQPSGQAAKKPAGDDFFSDIGGKTMPAGERRILFYRNPMNPAITSKVPAKDEMGMDYVPVFEEAPAGATEVADRAEVRLDDETIRRTGVRTARAQFQELARSARAVGRVVPDETRVRVVSTKVGGWVEKLHVNYLGQKVEKGQPLLTFYSPELLATQEEYLRARGAAARLKVSSDPEAGAGAEDLTRLAASRLKLFDVPEEAVARLDSTGKAERTVTLKAPISGYVTGKEIFEGSKIEEGMGIFTVTDLDRVWVEADFYEYEASAIAVGGEAVLTLPNDPAHAMKGRVAFVSPVVSPETRTIKARFEFPNQGLVLKPGMFADVAMNLNSARGVVVPDSALIDTGVRQLVYVESAAGVFEPRAVTVALRADAKAVLSSGVREGEAVVVRANFLLDSESRLRSTISKMTAEIGKGEK